jgi:CRISPR-associated endonuclease/helicase Cas3
VNTNSPLSFQDTFEALTGHRPFPWQEKLYERLLAGELPRHCDVPTGLGKTSVIAVWIAALGASLCDTSIANRVPRRLVYIVDRRVVVDQATKEVEQMQMRLQSADENETLAVLRPLVATLMQAATVPVASGVTVSTLRGKFEDNHAWHLDPSRPAIVVGTVDMIGSRMLFAGYGGVGRNWRSLQAGLILQDAWVVLDEAHLVPPFESLLSGLERYSNRSPGLRHFGVTRMSATLATETPGAAPDNKKTEEPLFGPDDENDLRVAKRLNAPKSLRFVIAPEVASACKPAEKCEKMAEKMAQEAFALGDGKWSIAVFADTVDLVKAINTALRKLLPKEHKERVLMLTGEMRGHERDGLITNEVLKAFAPGRERDAVTLPAFLVATACVEVGMDFDADHAVCDSVALERIIQRFGRVNRRGETHASIHLVLASEPTAPAMDKIDELEPKDAAVLILRLLPANEDTFDACSGKLRALDLTSAIAKRAFSRLPVAPPLDEARLDDWSLTSLKADEFPRPQVSYWLRGVMEDESVTTSLIWRADIGFADTFTDAAAMADTIPIAPREVAQISTSRATALLAALAKKDENVTAVIRSASGDSKGRSLRDFEDATKTFGELAFATVILPANLGGLLKGIPDASTDALKEKVEDIVESNQWRRAVFKRIGSEIEAAILLPNGEIKTLSSHANKTEARKAVVTYLRALNQQTVVRFDSIIGDISAPEDEADEEQSAFQKEKRAVAYFQLSADESLGRDEDARSLGVRSVTLAEHTRVIEAVARKLGVQLSLSPELSEVIAISTRWHDRGKDRRWWQAAIGNPNGESLAKSGQSYFDHSLNKGYRHEFGSLIEARYSEELNNHPQRELILHLIAAHHGHARPSFAPEAFDRSVPTSVCAAIAAEVPERFVALQQHYGWWTLAWLEALVKCADAIASANPNWPSK